MPALNLSFAEIKDPAAFAEYVKQAAEVMKHFNVEVVARGDYAATVAGPGLPCTVGAAFRYPSLAEARAFFDSDQYRALIPLREKACNMTILLFEEAGHDANTDNTNEQETPS
jgi:uncharacterized protein (DUF1330 family)